MVADPGLSPSLRPRRSPPNPARPGKGARLYSAIHSRSFLVAHIAETVFKVSAVNSIILQHIHHVDMATCERPINPGSLQDVQVLGPYEGPRTIWIVGRVANHVQEHGANRSPGVMVGTQIAVELDVK